MAALKPYQPTAPVTSQSESIITVTWDAPYNGGTAITSYQVTFRASDGTTFSPLIEYCNGTSSAVLSSRKCSIPSVAFTAPPFNLPWGSSIYAKVTAINIQGSSVTSPSGNGGVILRIPDAPIGFANVPALTFGNQIGLTWTQGV
jgi:hypothetical protein